MGGGVFVIRDRVNEVFYLIGSLDLDGAVGCIRRQLREGTYTHKILQQQWENLGEDCFVFEVLERAPRGFEKKSEGQYLEYLRMRWEQLLKNQNRQIVSL